MTHQIMPELSRLLGALLTGLPVATLVVIGAVALHLLLGRLLGLLAAQAKLGPAEIAPVRNLLRWILTLGAAILVLTVFGFQLGGLWTLVTTVLAMIAIGFIAVWSMLSNTTATVLLLLLRPFQIGDDIEFAGEAVKGRVVDLNFFFTTLRDAEGGLLQIPNNMFFQKTLKRRRNDFDISLAQQLNTPGLADLPAPPATSAAPVSSAPPPDPNLLTPDPRSMGMPAPGKK
jgi:small-conductance mechanosensitive channel